MMWGMSGGEMQHNKDYRKNSLTRQRHSKDVTVVEIENKGKGAVVMFSQDTHGSGYDSPGEQDLDKILSPEKSWWQKFKESCSCGGRRK
jgi:DUF971 family protein